MQNDRFGGVSGNFRLFSAKSGLGRTWRLLALWLGVLGLLLASLSPAAAADGALDPNFNPGLGVSKIPMIRAQADWTTSGAANGNSLICGYFTAVKDSVKTYNNLNSIAKLTDTNGTVDPNFNIPVNGEVRGAYLSNPNSPTCDIIIWGAFSLTSGGTWYNLARLTWNGSAYAVDPTFPVIFNPGGLVNTVAVMGTYGSSVVLVGGSNLQPVGGAVNTAYHLIGLKADFSYNSTYGHALSLPGGVVNFIAINGSNQPRIFGTLPQSGGGYHWFEALGSDFVTLTKSLGTGSSSGVNYGPIDGPIYAMAQTSAGPYIIVGAFKNVYGTGLNHVAQLNSTLTALDGANNFNTNIMSSGPSTGGADHHVINLYIMGTGPVILAGNLTSFNNSPCGHLVRLNSNGTVDTTFTTNAGKGADDRIFKLYQPAGGAGLQIVGSFQNYYNSNTPRHGIASLDTSGNLQAAYANVTPQSNTPGTVYAIEDSPAGLYIGGDFTGVGGKFHQNLARLHFDGSVDDTFISTVEGQVRSVRGLDNGQVLIAGNFGAASGYGCAGLARLNQDDTVDTNFKLPIVTQANGTVADLRTADVDDSGNIVIGGDFSTVNGSARTAFALLRPDGSLDTSFNFTPPSALTNIRVNAGGSFGSGYGMVGKATYGGFTRGFGCIVTSTGVLDTNFAIGQSPVANVFLCDDEVLTAEGGKGGTGSSMYLVGKFTHISNGTNFSIPRGCIARFNTADWTLDTTWAPAGADSTIGAIRVHHNGKVLIGGAFTAYNSTARSGVARLNADGSLDPSFDPGIGVDGPVYAINWNSWIGEARIGGSFTHYNGTSRPGLAQIFAGPISRPNPAPYLLLLLDL
jgi:uncharacterized delta-60 repeat protein